MLGVGSFKGLFSQAQKNDELRYHFFDLIWSRIFGSLLQLLLRILASCLRGLFLCKLGCVYWEGFYGCRRLEFDGIGGDRCIHQEWLDWVDDFFKLFVNSVNYLEI